MQYMLLIHADETAFAAMPKAQAEAGLAAYGAYTKAMNDAGVLKGGDRLRPTAMTTTVTAKGGKAVVVDGPFAETKEQLGGYYLIEAKDLDEAISWASRCPGVHHGAVEIRPIWAA
ncbi:MAG: YciI family protein [Hyphomicrobiales bacterium]|nr:YciI family protein [Hyphomicrobiales bacterium]